MKTRHMAVIAAVSLAALAGCSALGPNLPGGQNGGQQGGQSTGGGGSNSNGAGAGGAVTSDGSTTKIDCSKFATAVSAMFPAGVSAPYVSEGDTCVWGIGSNSNATGDALAQSLTDILSLNFSYGDDAETQYRGNDGELTGGAANLTKIDGVGTAASYYDGGTGIPQVSAWSGKVACGAHLFIHDASTVGLTSTGDSNTIVSASDEGGLAKKIADLCAIGWKG